MSQPPNIHRTFDHSRRRRRVPATVAFDSGAGFASEHIFHSYFMVYVRAPSHPQSARAQKYHIFMSTRSAINPHTKWIYAVHALQRERTCASFQPHVNQPYVRVCVIASTLQLISHIRHVMHAGWHPASSRKTIKYNRTPTEARLSMCAQTKKASE